MPWFPGRTQCKQQLILSFIVILIYNKSLIFFKIKLVNIRPDEIVDGNPKLTLGLIWIIILNFQVSYSNILFISTVYIEI